MTSTSTHLNVHYECEHQELWHPGADLTEAVEVHIPSALGRLGYYVCVCVPEAWAQRLDDVVFEAKIGGLRPDDIRVAAGEDMGDTPAVLPSARRGYVWRLLCRARMSRGDGIVRLLDWPRGLSSTDLLLCTWTRYVRNGEADRWLAVQCDPLWAPTGIPLGGIGGGRVDLCRDGRFRNFSGNNNQDMPIEDPGGLPHAGFSVVEADRHIALSSRSLDEAEACPVLHFDGRFPQARLDALGVLPGVSASVQASGALCPHDLRRASLPGFLARWRIHNSSDAKRRVSCRFSWPNLIGVGGGIAQGESDTGKGDGVHCYWEETQGRTETVWSGKNYTAVRFSGASDPERLSSSGEHLLAVRQGGSVGAEAGCGKGCVWSDVELAPGETQTVDMALVWAMPHWVDSRGDDRGHRWQCDFKDAESMVAELLEHADDILERSGALARLLDGTELPDWLKARLNNCNYPLVTNSVWYRDGRFSINEGPTEMMGCYGTMDQRLGAHPATQLFFPELNARELRSFAAVQAPNGGINHDFGAGHLEAGPQDRAWPDIPCSFILQCARHAWSIGDKLFEKAMWPHVRLALLRVAEWAEAGKGVPQSGDGLGTSYDGYHYTGTTPYIGTLWLAALATVEEWCCRAGDDELAPRIAVWRKAALERMEHDLWNGTFYRTCARADGSGMRDTCFAGLLAGQHFSRMLTGRDVLPAERLLPCAEALVRLNGSSRFAIPPDEVDADGERTVMYGWLPYVEAFGLSAAASVGQPVMEIWERMMRSVEQKGQRLCDTRLMYRPDRGDLSWGSYYMTAPASWLVYDAVLDFHYAPERGTLRLNPALRGSMAVVHPLWWGTADVTDSGIRLTVDAVFSGRPITVRAIARNLGRQHEDSAYREEPLPEPVYLRPGAVIEWSTAVD